MKNIQPTYATFEQAKMLKEKGFDGECARFYTKSNCNLYGIDEHGRYYPIKNKSKELWIVGNVAVLNIKNLILAPEQWQVVEWLRINHGIWIYLIPAEDNKNVYKPFFRGEKIKDFHLTEFFNSPQEAYSAAFNYILNNLI